MIYVDNFRVKFKGLTMSHLMADTDEELDNFALKIGLKPGWKQSGRLGNHFDISESKRKLAVKFGAKEVTPKDLVKIFR